MQAPTYHFTRKGEDAMIEMIPQQPYKRHRGDSSNICPYCGKNFTMNYERYRAQHIAQYGVRFNLAMTTCKRCGKQFWLLNASKQWVRETGIPATYPLEFVKGIR
jgi:uncharacterized protein with PIN domain